MLGSFYGGTGVYRDRLAPRPGRSTASRAAPNCLGKRPLQNQPSRPVSIMVGSRVYRGKYVVRGGMITVTALGQSETTQTGRMPVDDLARHLLLGMVHLWTPMPG